MHPASGRQHPMDMGVADVCEISPVFQWRLGSRPPLFRRGLKPWLGRRDPRADGGCRHLGRDVIVCLGRAPAVTFNQENAQHAKENQAGEHKERCRSSRKYFGHMIGIQFRSCKTNPQSSCLLTARIGGERQNADHRRGCGYREKMFCEHAVVMRAIETTCNTLLPLRLLAFAVPELTDIRLIKLNGLGGSPWRSATLSWRSGTAPS
jgi:hypothetical protein